MMDDFDTQLTDQIDVAILMHCDAHFSGRFDSMIDYYRKGGRGIDPEFDLKRIEMLAELEKQNRNNLAVFLLSGTDAEKVAKSKRLYKKLRDLYEEKELEGLQYALLIADLILTEDPEAKEEIAAIVKEKGAIVPSLLEVLRAPDFHDPLFPGYGQTPEFVMRCLSEIGDKRAIISLFEEIGRSDFFNEDLAIKGLKRIGDPTKEFLLRVLQSHPITEDNERAAIALGAFKEDPDVAQASLQMLQKPEVRQELPLANYLAINCEGLCNENDQQELIALANDPTTPKALGQEIIQIVKVWGE